MGKLHYCTGCLGAVVAEAPPPRWGCVFYGFYNCCCLFADGIPMGCAEDYERRAPILQVLLVSNVSIGQCEASTPALAVSTSVATGAERLAKPG